MKNSVQLIRAFNRLPKDEQRILYVISVIYIAVNQTNIQKILKALKWQDRRGQALCSLMAKPLREKLLACDVLVLQGSKIRCNPKLVEHITRTEDKDVFANVESFVDSILSLNTITRYDKDFDAYQQWKIRSALYLEHFPKLWQKLGIKNPQSPSEINDVETLIDICTSPFDALWLQEQPLELQIQVLIPLLRQTILDLKDPHEIYDLIEQGQANGYFQQDVFTRALIEHRIIKLGNYEELLQAEQSLISTPDSDGLLLRATLMLLNESYDDIKSYDRALTTYEEAILLKRKESKKRNVLILGFHSALYGLALFMEGSPESFEKLRQQRSFYNKTSGSDQYSSIITSLSIGTLIDTSHGYENEFHLKRLQYAGYVTNALLAWVNTLLLRFLGEEIGENNLVNISKGILEAEKNNYLGFIVEAGSLLAELQPESEYGEIKEALTVVKKIMPYHSSILTMMTPQAPWQRALIALQGINAPPEKSTTRQDTDQDQRMIWLFSPNTRENTLQPRVQKRGKKGWSKGRAVSLQRLYDDDLEYNFVSLEDKKICAEIEERNPFSGYHNYRNKEYVLPHLPGIQAAIGHPHIYWENTPSERIELSQGEPELHVVKHDQVLAIHLHPASESIMQDLESHDGVRVISCLETTSLNQLKLIVFSNQHLEILRILGSEGLTVPLNAKQQVLDSLTFIAPLLTVHSDIGGIGDANSIDPDEQLHLHLQPEEQGIKLACYAQPLDQGPLFIPGEGGSTVFAEVNGSKLQTTRNLTAERASFDALLQVTPQLNDETQGLGSNDWVLPEPDQALEVLQILQQQQNLALHWPQGQAFKLRPNRLGVEEMQLSIQRQNDWFELDGELAVSEKEVLSFEQLMSLFEQSPGRFLRLQDGEFIALTETLQQRLSDLSHSTQKGRFHTLASPVLDEITADMDVQADEAWLQQKQKLQQACELTPVVPSTLRAELRDYQQQGFAWLARLAHWGAGACLADDMGLGKTVQALALILSRASEGPALILAPTSVCFNWLEEALRFAPTLNALRFGEGDRQAMLDQAGPFDLIVCSYGLLPSEAERLQSIHWHTLVADEAQALKNPQAKRTKAAMALNADFKMVATGTPIENHLGELWSLFRFINPGLLGSQESFNERFAAPIEKKDTQASQHLKSLLQPFILRRLKTEVLTELPARIETTIHVEQSDEEKAFYEALRRNALKNIANAEGSGAGQQRVKILAELMKLRRACCHPQLVMKNSQISSSKLKAFAAILSELLENKHKVLVFSQFVGHLKIIRELLEEQQVEYQYLDGSTPSKKRQQAVNNFQKGEGDVFLISLKAGGSGLNLTAADYVIHMDPWWNPAVEDQASDRAHRMGQKRPVTIYRMITSQTIEEKILAMHQQKRDLASQLLEGTEQSGQMSLDDMLNLLKET